MVARRTVPSTEWMVAMLWMSPMREKISWDFSRMATPAGVGVTPRLVRFKRVRPSSFSSLVMEELKEGCEIKFFSAATEMEWYLQASKKQCS